MMGKSIYEEIADIEDQDILDAENVVKRWGGNSWLSGWGERNRSCSTAKNNRKIIRGNERHSLFFRKFNDAVVSRPLTAN